ncbi:uncharacterized protein Z520_05774 [Fonsecaea multimorphosa CBS 102226]|uniref:Uncharacterized protein n=1 Tax=Fonsecaea multimorphosa CBS 102226 TaxID=1442371 RepID=A0A0D2KP70_9EURO|nr:uncharacterized protein Z520_05774 [Fonsecaea multimorphosa CBS 102226]KIX98473.1 hypothetical protein Z520_05774 [Fonsecaea multimorphosa CBS 102226]OAL24669.1 hypothetical protein AYO22_05458 [Fonsecaea multimorphosa]
MSRRQRDGAINRATKGIGGLIGLAVEAHAQHKNKKSSTVVTRHDALEDANGATRSATLGSQHEVRKIDEQESLSDEDDEDEEDAYALESILPPSYDEAISPSSSSTTPFTTIKPLPYPIILPQRRPHRSSRGFIRAYAPILQTHKNISQTTFLQFLKDFQQSSRASPVFHAINIGAIAAGFAPSMIAMAVGMGVQFGAQHAMAIQERVRTNNFLDKANRDMFWPVGLHAMITTFSPAQSNQRILDVDTGRPLPSSAGGTTDRRELAIPQSAPLIFPDVDEEVAGDNNGQQPASSWKRGSKFVNSYFDRRAQAAYPDTYADSNAQQTFTSRYSDPNHPANSGSPLALLTGGIINPRGDQGGLLSTARDLRRSSSHKDEGLLMRLARTVSDASASRSQPHHNSPDSEDRATGYPSSRDSADRRPHRRQRRDRRRERSGSPQGAHGAAQGSSDGGRGGLRQVLRQVPSMQQGVLYLVIAEIPDSVKEEMARTRQG